MRALVVDDEPLVRGELVYMLGKVARDCEVQEADSAAEALALLERTAFDVVFLDIRMPALSGLEAVAEFERLPKRPHVVFVSAYDDHAVDAFEVAALDYLLKPVTEERLAATLKRLRAQSRKVNGDVAASGRLPVDVDGRTLLVKVDEIRYVEARGRIVSVSLFDERLRFRGSLAEAEERLERNGFLRVHRAYLVNPQRVVEVNPFLSGTYVLRVDDRARSEVPVSRNYVPAIRAAFEL
jgi:DNA-binding LytR/AlgR family response regulator